MASSHPSDQPGPADAPAGNSTTRRDLPDLSDTRYELLEMVGEGGMGRVYRAVDRQLDRQVAIKAIRPDLVSKPTVARRLAREAKFAAQLDHPFICKVHELIERTDGQALLVMEYVEGETLKSVLRNVPLDLGTVIRLARELAEALSFAHQRGLIHRDIKPGNVIMTLHDHIKVMDFGVAKAFDADLSASSALTGEGHVVGTPAYMSPEQAAGEPLDYRSDIFSFGVLLYECLSGHLPFEGSSAASYMRAAAVSAPKSLPKHVPAELRAIVQKCLAKEPGDRYENAEAVRRDLDRASLSLISAETHLTFSQRLRLGPRPWVAVTAVAVLISAAYLAIVWLGPPQPGSSQPRVQLPVVTWPSVEEGSRVSPDGATITFVSDRDGGERLWMRKTDGTEPRAITAAREAIKTPAWGPNSQQVAYIFRSDRKAWLEIISLWGESAGPARPIGGGWDDVALVRWIGTHIYYSVSAGTSASVLWRHDVSSGSDELVTHASGKRFTVSGETVNIDVRRDEKRIVFVPDAPDEGIWTSDLDGRNAEALPIKAAYVWTPRWRGRDGRRILYVANENGQADLWAFDFGTRTATPLTTSPLQEEAIDLSESGNVVVADTVERFARLWAINPDTGAGAQLTNDSRSDRWPSVAVPSGRMLFHRNTGAFIQSTASDTELIAGFWTQGRLDKTTTIGLGMLGAISPDGRRVFFQRRTSPLLAELWVRDVDGPDTGRKIADNIPLPNNDFITDTPLSQMVTWDSRGSDALYFVRRAPGAESQSEVVRASLNASGPPALRVLAATKGDLYAFGPSVSDDGMTLAFLAGSRRLYRGGTVQFIDINSANAQPVNVLQSTETAQLYIRGWTRRGTVVVLKTFRPDIGDKTEVWEVAKGVAFKRVASAPGLLGMTARLDAARDRLFATSVDRGVATVRMIPLSGGTSKPIVSNTMEGITFAGHTITPDGWLVYVKKETNYDVWVFHFR